ncbi:MAG: Amino acid adenylation domain protein [Pedosphaera sp.]|nr:Amino acid adenylation domain protein [Pedosphaera sp.]
MNSRESSSFREEVAIVGMAGRFPGAANVDQFWQNLCQGIESVRTFTPAELAGAGTNPGVLNDPNYVNAGVVLEEADSFDANFFGYHPREVEVMDPQHRVFLECAWSALEHAGYDPETYNGLIGVYGGVARNNYLLNNLAPNPGLLERLGAHQTIISNDKDFPATRVAFKLNLRGPSLNVQTACSSSGVAIHLACQSLLTGECDMALAGGARIRVPMMAGYFYEEGGIQSPDGHCRAFDAQARGTVLGSGVAMLVLKRLSDALSDGDCIHAVIKATAINNDGAAKVGFTAPSVEGQARVIAEAQAMAGTPPETISYIEAHGTGTSLGDPIEIAALTRAFSQGTQKKRFCAVGSVKTNIGHLDAGAGAAGVIKTVLALKHGKLPASLNFEKPNPQIDFENSPFYVNSNLAEWKRESTPRRAGVSSFGLGGTNAHIILEEAPEVEPSSASRSQQLIVLSAKSISALDQATANLAAHLENNPQANLADVAYTLQTGRRGFGHRRVVICQDVRDAASVLRSRDPQRVFSRQPQAAKPKLIFMFPGQGAQQVNMGLELYQSEPTFRQHIDKCAQLLKPHLRMDLREVLYPKEAQVEEARHRLRQTLLAQTSLFVVAYAMAQQWLDWGVEPEAMIGHSVGEYVAACLAGVLSVEDILGLLAMRGHLMQDLPEGGMLAVSLPDSEAKKFLGPELSLAAVNSPTSCVISGPREAVARLEQQLGERKIAHRQLQTSHAFHSAMVDPILEPFTQQLGRVKLNPPRIPFISSPTGTWITSAQATDPVYWARHMRETVRFADGLGEVLKVPDCVLLEVGPGNVLSALAKHPSNKHKVRAVVPSLGWPQSVGTGEPASLLSALGQLWLEHIPVNWTGFYAREKRQRVGLPSYPFERKRYWIDPPMPKDAAHIENTVREEFSWKLQLHAETTISGGESVTTPEPSLNGNGDGPTAGRKEYIVQMIKGVLHDLSGVSMDELNAEATFLGLGFDSLFLTQVGLAFQKKFETKITLRHLIEDHPSLDALAGYIDSLLPPERFLQSPAGQKPGLSLVQNGRLTHTSKNIKLGEAKRFGPFQAIERHATHALTAQQQNALKELITRYTKRTQKSKALTQTNRSQLADPRTISGFKLLWKEMVYPITAVRSSDAKIWDVDGNEYIDFTMGYGIHLFGHSPPFVVEAMTKQLAAGMQIGPQSPLAGEVAGLICEFTGLERVAFCNTGSEAVLAALRVARTVTGRNRIAFFTGSYHGINDEVLIRANLANGTRHQFPVAPGMIPGVAENALVLDYGTPESLELIRAHGHELAAVIVEAVQSRHPDLQPGEFLKGLREVTAQSGTALIFDEVITGFRLHPRGAQGWYGVQADLATYGKVIGGGMPMGAVAGISRFMDAFDGGKWFYGDNSIPETGVTFFAGTFVRHPLALSASAAVLRHLKKSGPGLQQELNDKSDQLARELNEHFTRNGVPLLVLNCGSVFYFRFEHENGLENLLFYYLRERGVHIWEGRPCFLSTAHSAEDIRQLVRAFKESVEEMQANGFLSFVARTGSETGHRFPLTPAQMEIWLETQMGDQASCHYNESHNLLLRGPFNVQAMHLAVQKLVNRHEALRTVFSPAGDFQQINTDVAVEIPFVDLTSMDVLHREAKLAEMQSREGQAAFDLAHGPLLRVSMIRLEEQTHVVLITMHHIICDGWSLAVVLRELGELYSAAVCGALTELAPAMQFSAYAQQQSGESERAEQAKAERYWVERFAGPVPQLELPGDFTRPATKNYHVKRVVRTIPSSPYQDLKRVSARCGSTLFTTLLAGFEVLLHRLGNQDDIVLGIPIAAQASVGGERLVGHCTHLLPLRSHFEGKKTFLEFVRTVQQEVMQAHEHHNYTFGALIQKLNLPRDPSRVPLISVVFNVDRVATDLSYSGLELEAFPNPKQFLNFDLNLNIRDTGKELHLECDFDIDLFLVETIQRWLGHYETLLLSMATNPEQRLCELPLMTREEKLLLLKKWNHTQMEFPERACVHELFEAQAARSPEATALVDGTRRVTYAELNSKANQLAHHLRSLGVGPEKLVGICVKRSAEMLVGMLGIMKAGGAYVPMDPAYPKERIAFMLKDANVSVLLTQSAIKSLLPGHGAAAVCLDREWETIAKGDQKNPINTGTSENLAYVIYTSGSTGQPKGVAIEHRSVVNLLTWAGGIYSPDELAGVLASTSICFDISVFELFAPLSWGGTIILAENALQLASLPAVHEVTLINTVPSAMAELLRARRIPNSVITINLAGEPLPASLVEQIHQLPHVRRVFDLYGPTEDTVYSTFSLRKTGERATIGRPIANTQAYILDAQGAAAAIGVAGELHLGGVGLARGYLNQPELTAAKFLANAFSSEAGARLYKTGDWARYLPDGRIELLGRMDHQVKIRGFRIELGEIEAALRQHENVGEVVVVAGTSRDEAKQLIAYVTPRNGEIPGAEELRRHLKVKLPDYMVPKFFVTLDSLPLTANGKVDRKALPVPDQTGTPTGNSFVAPRTNSEMLLAVMWSEVLGRDKIGIHDNFFEIGGDSLLIFRMSNRAAQAGLGLKPKHFFQYQTIAGLATVIEAMAAKKAETTAQLRNEVSQMSAEEVKRLLLEKKRTMAGL